MVKEDLPFVGYHNLSSRTSKYFKRDGAEVEKGVVLTEPYLENEDASDWANLTRYAEDNLQKAYNFGYDECYHISMDIIKKLVDCIRFLNSNRNTELSDVDEFLKNAEKFIEVGK